MSQLIHILSSAPQGCLLPDRKCSGVSHRDHISFPRHARMFRGRQAHRLQTSITFATAGNWQKNNPDYSRPNGKFSKGKNRDSNQEYDSHAGMDSYSQNGPSHSSPSNPRQSAPVGNKNREKEIIALFRDIQAKIRKQSGTVEGKKTEQPSPQPKKEDKAVVDSLLSLLRKGPAAVEKKPSGKVEGSNQIERENTFEEEENSNYFTPDSLGAEEEVQETSPPTRPISKFQRKSPVPKTTSAAGIADSSMEFIGRKGKARINGSAFAAEEDDDALFDEDEEEEEFEDDLSDVDDEIEEESAEASASMVNSSLSYSDKEAGRSSVKAASDLGSLKLTDLHEIAKSRGMKGYSKLKKVELVKLLEEAGA